jgi:small-conductance mechanosensitive channel
MATPTPPPPMSAAERLLDSGRDIWRDLAALDPQVAGLNLLFTAIVVALAFLLTLGLRRLFDHWINRFAAKTSPETRTSETPRAASLTWLLTRLAVLSGALVLVAAIWGVDIFAWLGGGAGGGIFRAIGVIILAVGAIEVAGFVVDHLVDGFAKRSGDGRRAAQIRTLGPLIRGFIQSVLVVVSALTFLSEVGVKVGPLLASAGVVGVAIGFGAQTLVKDFLTGLFLIAEDVVSVGDNVQIGDSGGTVEAMTLRTIRLRDQNGTLHVFPYSEAQVIHNRTKTFSSYVFEVMVTYGSDVDHALEVMGRLGEDMRREPDYAQRITRPFEVLGVDRLDALGVMLKARVTTQPRDQWAVGREYNRRLKLAFEQGGIDFAYRPPGPPAATVPTAGDEGKLSALAEKRSFSAQPRRQG